MSEIVLRIDPPPEIRIKVQVDERRTQTKQVTPTEDGLTVTPDAGFLLERVDVEPVPWVRPQGKVELTENADDVDVARYAAVKVNVPRGVFPAGTLPITEDGPYDVTAYAAVQVRTAPEKGLVFSDYDENGYPTKATVKGLKTIPTNYFINPSSCFGSNLQLIVEDGTETLQNQPFYNNTAIKTAYLPDSCAAVNNAFRGCSNMVSLSYGADSFVSQLYTFINSFRQIHFRNNLKSFYGGANINGGNVELYDFSNNTEIAELKLSPGFQNPPIPPHKAGCVFRVPAELLNDWKSADVWKDIPTDPEVAGYVIWEGV